MSQGILWATLSSDSIEALEKVITRPNGMIAPKHFHITLIFNVDKDDLRCQQMLGKILTLKVSEVRYNHEIMAISVNLSKTGLTSCKQSPHITWGLTPGTPPVKSDEILENSNNSILFTPTQVQVEVEFFEFPQKK